MKQRVYISFMFHNLCLIFFYTVYLHFLYSHAILENNGN